MTTHCLWLLFSVFCLQETKPPDFTPYVNPQIGSVHGRWFFYTPAALPFGMAKLAPHTNAYGSPGSWLPCGYDDRHTSIEGFGNLHEFQIGGIVLMPTVGTLQVVPGSLEDPEQGYRSRFDKSSEQARAGYYTVLLKDYHIKAELTATRRVGFHRYTFPESTESHIIFDIGHRQGESGRIIDAQIAQVGERAISGKVITYPFYVHLNDTGRHVTLYFYAELSKTPSAVGTFTAKEDKPSDSYPLDWYKKLNTQLFPQKNSIQGRGSGLYVSFSTHQDEAVVVKVGVSYTSIDNAKANLTAEAADLTFDAAYAQAHDTWQKMLGRIEIEDANTLNKQKFYTGLYHALLGRGMSSDSLGAYPAKNGSIGSLPMQDGRPVHNQYNTDGLWESCWNLFQLWNMVYPDVSSDFLQGILGYYKECAWTHDGMAAGAFVPGVPSNFSGLLLASAYQCGIRDYDVELAYQAARNAELVYKDRPFGVGKYDLEEFITQGYIALDEYTTNVGWVFNFGASHTLEYSFTSSAVAKFAHALGKEDDARQLTLMSKHYQNLFDPDTKFMRPREKDGTFLKAFDPMKAWIGFQEGNSYQYTWLAPHDIDRLIEMMGRDVFNERLENTFRESRKSLFGGGQEIDSFSGLEKLYNHGNQPCLFQPWLFNYSGRPELTQLYTRAICDEFYGATPEHGYGYGQDEDQGQLGAWFVLASMGLFDIKGLTDVNPALRIGSPMFRKITIHLNADYDRGSQFVIKTVNNSSKNVYVQSATLNGMALQDGILPWAAFVKGGQLELSMGKTPPE
ncbi:MAG: GH92 family glycosyl hydrolase [Phycisphaerae bacterium]|nr:GH92 family glycosyl hydrolase [Phycisphaerae bacterium]